MLYKFKFSYIKIYQLLRKSLNSRYRENLSLWDVELDSQYYKKQSSFFIAETQR